MTAYRLAASGGRHASSTQELGGQGERLQGRMLLPIVQGPLEEKIGEDLEQPAGAARDPPAALAAVLALLVLAAGRRGRSRTSSTSAIEALKSDPVYVDESAERAISSAEAERLRDAIREEGGRAAVHRGPARRRGRRRRRRAASPGGCTRASAERGRTRSWPATASARCPTTRRSARRGAGRPTKAFEATGAARGVDGDAAGLRRPHGHGALAAATRTRRRWPRSRSSPIVVVGCWVAARCSCRAAGSAVGAREGDGGAQGERARRPGGAGRRHRRARPGRGDARTARSEGQVGLRGGRWTATTAPTGSSRSPRRRGTWAAIASALKEGRYNMAAAKARGAPGKPAGARAPPALLLQPPPRSLDARRAIGRRPAAPRARCRPAKPTRIAAVEEGQEPDTRARDRRRPRGALLRRRPAVPPRWPAAPPARPAARPADRLRPLRLGPRRLRRPRRSPPQAAAVRRRRRRRRFGGGGGGGGGEAAAGIRRGGDFGGGGGGDF